MSVGEMSCIDVGKAPLIWCPKYCVRVEEVAPDLAGVRWEPLWIQCSAVECERDHDETTHARGLSLPGSAFNKLGQWMHPFCSQGPGLHMGSHENTFLPCLARGGAKRELHSLGATGGCEGQERGPVQYGSQSQWPCCLQESSRSSLAPILQSENSGFQPGQEPHAVPAKPSSPLLDSLSFSALHPQLLLQISVLQGAEHQILRVIVSGKPICFPTSAFNCWELPVPQLRAIVLKVWTPDQQPEHRLGTVRSASS